jgi:hypothetical protein
VRLWFAKAKDFVQTWMIGLSLFYFRWFDITHFLHRRGNGAINPSAAKHRSPEE